jgi:hypothetical protein
MKSFHASAIVFNGVLKMKIVGKQLTNCSETLEDIRRSGKPMRMTRLSVNG